MELRECLVWRGPYRVQKKATGPDETRTEIRVLHPETPPTREDIKVFVARCVIMGRRWFVNSKDAGAGSISIGQVVIDE